ncbi:hypothetical protein QJS66_22800 [Kocuria rhizophila]|nr:hypothetical protein QJS66_22800 [Kocuria rhizophila]
MKPRKVVIVSRIFLPNWPPRPSGSPRSPGLRRRRCPGHRC